MSGGVKLLKMKNIGQLILDSFWNLQPKRQAWNEDEQYFSVELHVHDAYG